jgi:homoserine acetyltransferase
VEGYLNYQGEKFIRRFDPLCYVRLTQLLDSHDLGSLGTSTASATSTTTTTNAAAALQLGRDAGRYKQRLRDIRMPTFVVGIDSDILYPVC